MRDRGSKMVVIKRNFKKIKINMGWKHISYTYGGEKLVFNIEPMIGEADIVYIPNDEIWNSSKIGWVNGNKDKILSDIKSFDWNRDLVFDDCETDFRIIPAKEDEILKGTIESTQAAKEFENLALFDPNKKVDKKQTHELWCTLEKRFAEGVEGKVTICASEIKENSVFNKITIPTLSENDKVTLNVVGS